MDGLEEADRNRKRRDVDGKRKDAVVHESARPGEHHMEAPTSRSFSSFERTRLLDTLQSSSCPMVGATTFPSRSFAATLIPKAPFHRERLEKTVQALSGPVLSLNLALLRHALHSSAGSPKGTVCP